MVTFSPPELREKLAKAFVVFRKILKDIDIDFYPVDDPDFDPSEHDDIVVTDSSLVKLSIPRSDDVEVEISAFFDLCNELPNATLVGDVEYRSTTRTLIRISPTSDRAIEYLYHSGEYTSVPSLELDFSLGENKTIKLSLVNGFSPFALLISKSGNYDKYNPPYGSDDLFLQAIHPDKTKKEIVDQAINAYMFELSVSLELDFTKSPRPSEWVSSEEKFIEQIAQVTLRPLIVDTSLNDVLELYNRAVAQAHDEELAILVFVKVLEYISATVVRMTAYEEMRRRLLSPKALKPDARFISELITLIENQKINRKDSEALRLTIEMCCDAVELAKISPEYIDALKKLSEESSAADKKKALSRLAACFSATRNEFAHAKANYELTGDECPLGQRSELARCARLAAQQAIRWFSLSDADLRAL